MKTGMLWAGTIALAAAVMMPGEPVRATGTEARVAVVVTNDNSLDVDIFALFGQQRVRLGSVVTGRTQTFDLPPAGVGAGQVRLSAEPVGSRAAYTSQPVSISDGQRIRLTVAPQLAQSRITVEAGP